jgi:hypothetical protein
MMEGDLYAPAHSSQYSRCCHRKFHVVIQCNNSVASTPRSYGFPANSELNRLLCSLATSRPNCAATLQWTVTSPNETYTVAMSAQMLFQPHINEPLHRLGYDQGREEGPMRFACVQVMTCYLRIRLSSHGAQEWGKGVGTCANRLQY